MSYFRGLFNPEHVCTEELFSNLKAARLIAKQHSAGADEGSVFKTHVERIKTNVDSMLER
jgi:hypothetical protein